MVRMAYNLYCNGTPSVLDYDGAEEQIDECRLENQGVQPVFLFLKRSGSNSISSTIFLDNILNTCNTINAFIVLQYWR